jgi:GntR family transcriptional regulator, carbon starvation induced regulator
MKRKAPGKTLADSVHDDLRAEICAGRIAPGERLSLGELSKSHEVSLTVVREAVTRLASERLVKATPHEGFTVWPLSVDDLLDITRVRVEVEALAVRESVERGDVEWEAELIAAHHRLVGAGRHPNPPGEAPRDEWMAAHANFHAALAEACTSPLLKQLRRQLFDASELYRHWSKTLVPTKRRAVADEHKAILDAAVGHDADKVVDLLSAHIRATTERILSHVGANGS